MLNKFMIASDGNLYDTTKANWTETPLRKNFSCHHREIKSCNDFKSTLRTGGTAWPGGYTLAFLTSDGAALCFFCAKKHIRSVFWSIKNDCSDGWKVIGLICESETDEKIICDHCSKNI